MSVDHMVNDHPGRDIHHVSMWLRRLGDRFIGKHRDSPTATDSMRLEDPFYFGLTQNSKHVTLGT